MNGHPTRDEDFDLYALGTLASEENAEIESHIASCAACRLRLAEAKGRVVLLGLAAPTIPPSPRVKVRLMKQVQADKRGVVQSSSSREGEQFGGSLRYLWPAILVPLLIVLAIASVFLWTQNRRLAQELAGLHDAVGQQQHQLRQASQIADLVTARDTVTVELVAQPGTAKGTARILYSAATGMLLYDGELTPAPTAKTYQLWLVPAHGNPISAGVFGRKSEGKSHFIVMLPQGIVAKAFAVTLEPAGGQPQPTGSKVLVGASS